MKRNSLEKHKPQIGGYILFIFVVITFVLYANPAFALDPDPLQSVKDQVRTALAASPDPTPTGSQAMITSKPSMELSISSGITS
ncbi:MAG: hypothetical protein JW837_02925 [Sedimentisphaerales bacterium]|nr:hypothetical protein [Sedimentisphaerales bacterium]